MERIPLRVMGLSYSQNRTSAYALILAQADGPIRIPVVIGPAEAQAIAMRMENITPPRPMTHDLFANLMRAFGIGLQEVFILKFEDGIFTSELTFSDGERRVVMDGRTSDAIALAMRTGAPIYTTREVMEQTGFVMDERESTSVSSSSEPVEPEPKSIADLERELEQLIEREEYEQAQILSEYIRKRKEEEE